MLNTKNPMQPFVLCLAVLAYRFGQKLAPFFQASGDDRDAQRELDSEKMQRTVTVIALFGGAAHLVFRALAQYAPEALVAQTGLSLTGVVGQVVHFGLISFSAMVGTTLFR